MLGGRMAYFPFTKKYGKVFKEVLGVTWSSHRAFIKAKCQLCCSE